MSNDQLYKEIAVAAQKRRDDLLPESFRLDTDQLEILPENVTTISTKIEYFTADEIEIINSRAEDILVKIRSQIFTALDVTQAFCKAAVVAHQATNCLTEVLFAEALSHAKYLDEFLSHNGRAIGPFHGLPISLKDCFITPPHPSSVGIACYANETTNPDQETLLVQTLRELGAVLFCKTNIPVAMMMMETVNNIWGETRNPYNTALSPGGSSGGEAALLAMRGSPLGIGTDIGGSIRIPSAWCHLYGLKPSFGRFPVWGTKSGIPGQDFIYANNGPMARDLEALQFYCENVLSEEVAIWTKDPKCLPMPWRRAVIQPRGRKLRFAFVGGNDGIVTCHPPIERALNMTRKALEDSGHDIIDWAPIDHGEILKLLGTAFIGFGEQAIMPKLQQTGEPLFDAMKAYKEFAQSGENILGPTKLREMNLHRNALQKAYLDRWQLTAGDGKGPIDGIIMAVTPWAAARLGVTQKLTYVGYTGVWNVLDLPGCTFPVTFADQKLDKARSVASWKPLNELDEKIQSDYDPTFYDKAPVSLQLLGRRLEEEKVLEMVEVVAKALGSSRDDAI